MSSKVKSPAAMSGETAMVPKRRFPEFEKAEGWKETMLQKLARPVADRATTEGADNVLSLSGEHGLVLQSEYFGKKIAGDSTERYIKICKDDFVYNDRTTKSSSFGTIKRLSKYSDGIVSPIYKCFRFQPSENPVFWEWYFESGSHDPALGGLINEGARAGRFNISVTQFLSTNAWRPDEPEQQKIADCLDSADALIAAQGLKVKALRVHKKGLMQRLFPREGETHPRLRFSKFYKGGGWKANLLGDLVEIRSGYSPSQYQLRKAGAYPFVKVEDLNNSTKYQSEAREYSDETTGLIPCKSVIFPKRGAAIALNKIRLSNSELLIDTNVMALTPIAKCATEYLFYYISQIGLSQMADNSTIPQINNKHIIPLRILIPSLPEQNHIADCLTSLDELIAAETRKLNSLNSHKKGLMQQLFPSAGEGDA
jgi:type I restriction enzyme, S subunit